MKNITLRIIEDGAGPAGFIMAADLYLLQSCAGSPTVFIRFYEWNPPAISLGYMQKPADVLDLAACKRDNIDWIRRPTGGRAVLHQDDLTYSCVFSAAIREMGQSVAQTYEIISQCLISGLSKFGVRCAAHDSQYDSAAARRESKRPCFLAPSRREIMVDGKKLVGSAQKRTAESILQHGSIALSPSFRNLPNYENISSTQREKDIRLLGKKCTCIEELPGSSSRRALTSGLKRGFVEVLQLDVEECGWSAAERAQIEQCAESEAFSRQWKQ